MHSRRERSQKGSSWQQAAPGEALGRAEEKLESFCSRTNLWIKLAHVAQDDQGAGWRSLEELEGSGSFGTIHSR